MQISICITTVVTAEQSRMCWSHVFQHVIETCLSVELYNVGKDYCFMFVAWSHISAMLNWYANQHRVAKSAIWCADRHDLVGDATKSSAIYCMACSYQTAVTLLLNLVNYALHSARNGVFTRHITLVWCSLRLAPTDDIIIMGQPWASNTLVI